MVDVLGGCRRTIFEPKCDCKALSEGAWELSFAGLCVCNHVGMYVKSLIFREYGLV
jgi:hypothetical protein